MKKILLAAAVGLAAFSSPALAAGATFNVTATVGAFCTTITGSSTDLGFGTLTVGADGKLTGSYTKSSTQSSVETTGLGVVANISVNNTGATPLPVEIVVTPLQATATGFTPTSGDVDDLLVVPPTALIPARQTQTFRVQWIGDPALADSKHYYIGVNQVPVKLPEGTSAVQVVYNFQVLTSVASPSERADLVLHAAAPVAGADGKVAAVVTVENKGGAHGYLSQHRLRIAETDNSGKEIYSRTISGSEFQQLIGYGLVASHSTRSVTLPLDLPSSDGRVVAQLLDQQAQ